MSEISPADKRTHVLPLAAARRIGVAPKLFWTCTSAPWSSRACTSSCNGGHRTMSDFTFRCCSLISPGRERERLAVAPCMHKTSTRLGVFSKGVLISCQQHPVQSCTMHVPHRVVARDRVVQRRAAVGLCAIHLRRKGPQMACQQERRQFPGVPHPCDLQSIGNRRRVARGWVASPLRRAAEEP